MGFKVTCESSADLNQDMYKKLGVAVLPFTISIGGKDYKDGIDIDNAKLYAEVDRTGTLPKTSALNEMDYEDFFRANVNDDGLIHICLSSKISSTYNNAVNASKKFNNVYVVDSESLSSGMGLQVMYASEMSGKNVPVELAVKKLEERRPHMQISFVVDTLKYLHKGGRCSALALLGANLLSIKPQILLKDGKMAVGKKYRGKIHKVLKEYVIDTLNEFNQPDRDLCLITYSSATPEMLETVHATLDELNAFDNIIETTAGATVATHCGPNTLGIIYYNDGGADKYEYL